jgi:AcrR family transcriptional regulator
MADKKDLRVIKTKINIESTFLRLLKETTFEKITVRILLDEALISKGTFYAHYLDKYDLAEKTVHRFLNDFRTSIQERLNGVLDKNNAKNLWKSLLNTLNTVISDLNVLKKIHTENINVEKSMQQIFAEEYASFLKRQNIAIQNPDIQSFIFSTLAMSYLNYLQESPNCIPVYEYVKTLHNVTGQYLTQLNIMEKQPT